LISAATATDTGVTGRGVTVTFATPQHRLDRPAGSSLSPAACPTNDSFIGLGLLG